tara:strand:- start:11094 stop:12986 length:1893 start_codon:yes stop_codon:yes gene_type:complete
MRHLISALLASTSLALPAVSDNANLSQTQDTARLDPIEVVGLRPQHSDDITASVSLLTAENLAIRNSTYIADQLRATPGLGVSRSGSLGGLTQVRIRGAEANHTLALLNGFEISDPVTGETDFGLFSGLPLGRVEIVRGEQSAIYGSDAIGGVINMRTNNVSGLSGAAEIGSQATLRGNLSYGMSDTGGHVLLANISGFETEGVDTSGQDVEKDGSDALNALLTGSTQIGNAGEISGLFTWRTSSSETDPDLDFDGLLDNADRVSESDQWIIGGSFDARAFGLDHLLSASFNRMDRENFADGTSTDKTIGERSKLSYSPSVSTTAGAAELTFAGLVDWEREDYERQGVASAFGDPNQSQSFETLGMAGELTADIDALSLNASIRHDDNDGRFDEAVTWRVGAAFLVAPSTRFRASTGEGVKNPTFTELFGFYPGSFIGNPDLEPESSSSWEVGLDQTIGAAQLSLTYFQADLENEVYTAYTPSFASTPANRDGESQRSGLELAANMVVNEEMSLSGTISKISSENDAGLDEIRVPEWTASLGVNWASSRIDGLRAGLALDFVGEQLDTDFGAYQTVTLDNYLLVSGTFEYPVTDQISLTLRGENLLDEEISDVFGYHAPGAAAFVGLKLR